MVRTVIQLTDVQSRMLKRRAQREGVSVAELVRRGVDCILGFQPLSEEVRRKAMLTEDVPAFSDEPDVSVNHDKYLEEIYADDNNIR